MSIVRDASVPLQSRVKLLDVETDVVVAKAKMART